MTVAIFPNPTLAQPARDYLRQAGVQAEIHDELKLEALWFVSKAEAGARLEVPAEQFERASNLLLEWDSAESGLRNAVRCPECKSVRVEYPQFTNKSFLPNLALGLLAAVHLLEKEYYCEDCHYTWPKEGTKRSVTRPHAAPYYFIEGVEQTFRQPQEQVRAEAERFQD
jgi:predicted Zn-ribbon and HTH transcriptional regulator